MAALLDRAGSRRLIASLVTFGVALAFAVPGDAARRRGPAHEAVGHLTFASPQSNPVALSEDGTRLFVAFTTANEVVVLAATTGAELARIPVGIDPVGLAVRPGDAELWVANHISDSLSIVDVDLASPTLYQVLDTVQSLPDPAGATSFDEPVAIAFTEDGTKAYTSLSSRNQIAAIDATTRQVTALLPVRAQDPRAIAVRNGLLYVAAFESGNQTELSACVNAPFSEQCTLSDLGLGAQGFGSNPNLPGATKNIVVDPDVPDRDLFVFDTTTDAEVSVASGLGTLLYGVAVASDGSAFVTLTEARNAVNGIQSSDLNGDGAANLADLENRMFLNRIARVPCPGGVCGSATLGELEPLPPAQPAPGSELATPFGIAVSADDSTLVATAAGTSRVFTADASSLGVLDVLDLDGGAPSAIGQQIPRGLVLRSDPGTGAPITAYVLNTLENSVSVVDVSNPTSLIHVQKYPFGPGPTSITLRRGRVAFNNALASTSGTFSCASCHPDGNMDQVLWRIGGECAAIGCAPGEDQPRLTMPIRGLTGTLPLHWDGTLGDPFGGSNGAGTGGTDCALGDADGEHDCFLDLVDASLAGVMCDQDPVSNPAGCPSGGNELSAQERDQMASFLASVSHPPARSRRADDVLTAQAVAGVEDFYIDQGGLSAIGPDTCADTALGCHALPLGAATNSIQVDGFDSPSLRGLTDRFVHFSLGITNPEEILAVHSTSWDPDVGMDELASFETTFETAFVAVGFGDVYGPVSPADIFAFQEERSTGVSGATGRQVTVSLATTSGEPLSQAGLLDSPEGITETAAGRVFVLNAGMTGSPSIVEIDPSDGSQNLLASDVGMECARDVAHEATGDLVVAGSTNTCTTGIVTRIDALTGAQSTVSSGGQLLSPQGVAVGGAGTIYILDGGMAASPFVVEVDPTTGGQSVLAPTISIECARGIAAESGGDLVAVGLLNTCTTPIVTRFDATTGAESTVASGGLLESPQNVTVASDGTIYVLNKAMTGGAFVVAVDPTDGSQRLGASVPVDFGEDLTVSEIATLLALGDINTGTTGAVFRLATTAGAQELADTEAIMTALEQADLRGAANLRAVGVRNGFPVTLSFRPNGAYEVGALSLDHDALVEEAQTGDLAVTLTAHLRSGVDQQSQPLLSTFFGGAPPLPVLPADNPMTVKGVGVEVTATIFVDGAPVSGTLGCHLGTFDPTCTSNNVVITLDVVPPVGTHVLQLQNPGGLVSNELPIVVQ